MSLEQSHSELLAGLRLAIICIRKLQREPSADPGMVVSLLCDIQASAESVEREGERLCSVQ